MLFPRSSYLSFFMCVFIILSGIPGAFAESGTITIGELARKAGYTFYTTTGSQCNIDWTKLRIDVSTYKGLDVLIMNTSGTGVVYGLQANSTTFTIISGGTGAGTVTYQKQEEKIVWFFEPGSTVSSSTITVSYAENIFSAISTGYWYCGAAAFTGLSSEKPFSIWGSTENNIISNSNNVVLVYTADVLISILNSYTVTYSGNIFTVDISKAGETSLTKINIHNSTHSLFSESDFTITDLTYSDKYGAGLWINMSTVSFYNDVLVNTTNSGIIPLPTPVQINPVTGAGISFDRVNYTIGDLATVSYRFSDSSWLAFAYDYFVDLNAPSGNKIHQPALQEGNIQYLLDETGIWNGQIKRFVKFVGIDAGVLEYAQTTVSPEGQSVLLVNATAPTNKNFTAQYRFGFNPQIGTYTTGIKANRFVPSQNAYILERFINITNVSTQSNILYTLNVSLPIEGDYILCLWSGLKSKCVDERKVKAVYSPVFLPPAGITSTYLSIDSTVYAWGDMLRGDYAVKDSDFSTYSIIINVLNTDRNITTISQPLAEQKNSFLIPVQNSQDYSPVDYYNAIGQPFLKTYFLAGNNTVFLNGTSDGVTQVVLDSKSFVLSNTDSAGYGIIPAKSSYCLNEKVVVRVISPATAMFSIYDANRLSVALYNISFSGDKTITYSNTKRSQVLSFRLVDSNGLLRLSQEVDIKDCTPTATDMTSEGILSGGQGTGAIGVMDGLVGWLGLGINDISRFLFAIIIIIAVTLTGFLISTGNATGGIIVGMIPFMFFTYINYVPKWFILIALIVIALRTGWFR